MQILDGKIVAADIRAELKNTIASLKARGIEPGLATILVGENPASQVYVASKIKACEQLGIRSFSHHLPATATEEEILALITELNNDTRVNGILLQLPLPGNLNEVADRCVNAIVPEKDVDGLHPFNIGALCAAKNYAEIVAKKLLVSCTPLGVMYMLKHYGISAEGKNVVVIGRSNLFGKPSSLLFLSQNATVTIAHSRTADLAGVCRRADILVVAIGKPEFVNRHYVQPGAVVIDVGINRTADGIVGDVDFDDVKEIAGAITPVPGGVGATTITMLMRNTVMAAQAQNAQ
jgi:methylenetetrahydrofolate dehydrogenase (NADP+)/methenyltetrahydrofolate cyclohydrolase